MTSLEALVTGYIFGALSREVGSALIQEVLTQLDPAGNYLPFLQVRVGSGVLLRIEVTEDLATVEPAAGPNR